MLLDAGMDTGPILAQQAEPVLARDDALTLGARLARIGADLLAPTLDAYARGAIVPRPQDPQGATYSRLLTRGAGLIDWTSDAPAIDRRIRAFVPWPGAYTYWSGRLVKLLEGAALATLSPGAPGTVGGLMPAAAGAPAALAITTGAGTLAAWRLQMEGKRACTAAEFARGYPAIVGARFDSLPPPA
jgi:methionyl-tRNA formyltransferase